jgi:hypothetical protein
LTREFDAIYLDSVRPETLLWRYLQSSPLIQKSFRFYSQQGPLPHRLIRLNGSFSNYMKRFSPKTRKNRLREVKILRELGDVKLIRVTEVSEIDAFLKAAYGISKKTRQFKQFGWSIAARDPRLVKKELLRLARHRWLRSYLTPSLPEWTPLGATTVLVQFCSCSFWKIFLKKIRRIFMILELPRRTERILRATATLKLTFGCSASGLTLSWQAASIEYAIWRPGSEAPRWSASA